MNYILYKEVDQYHLAKYLITNVLTTGMNRDVSGVTCPVNLHIFMFSQKNLSEKRDIVL